MSTNSSNSIIRHESGSAVQSKQATGGPDSLQQANQNPRLKKSKSSRGSGAEGSSPKSTRKTKKPKNMGWEEHPDFDVGASPKSSISDVCCPDSPCYPKVVVPEEDVQHQHTKSAMIALAYYNKKNHTNYKLVEALWSNAKLYNGLWIHCNFKAKPDIPSKRGEDANVSSKLFFAELYQSEPFVWKTSACRVLNGSKTKSGCLMCKRGIHPTHGFRNGLYEYKPRTLRSRSGKVCPAAL
ncbi:hypothetical protein DM860_009232 [Cuscuta australis]|uniref:DUF3615 domain-containing protein n=1 Tax=Cuscuta australis TaxID=267555 RepID=A0A328DAH5_9ASTE|nr:hypothetical protein DM860_009232 [Cuscuta australis]